MFNNINENNRDFLYDSQMKASNVINLAQIRAKMNKDAYSKNPYVDKTEISANAMELFQKDLDIKKFTELAISDPNDKSYMSKVQELFNDGVIDVYEDDVLKELADNPKLWEDIDAE